MKKIGDLSDALKKYAAGKNKKVRAGIFEKATYAKADVEPLPVAQVAFWNDWLVKKPGISGLTVVLLNSLKPILPLLIPYRRTQSTFRRAHFFVKQYGHIRANGLRLYRGWSASMARLKGWNWLARQ